MSAGPCSRGEFVACLFLLLDAAGIPWLVATSLQSLPPWWHYFLFLSVCEISLIPCLIRTLVMVFRVHWIIQDNLSVTISLITSPKILYRVTITGSSNRAWCLWEPLFRFLQQFITKMAKVAWIMIWIFL